MIAAILPKLTKNYILNNIGINSLDAQVQIFAEYLIDIGSPDIYHHLARGGLLHSPLRKDKNATCSFYIDSKDTLRLRDWAGYFFGDCFDLVGYKEYLDATDSVDFNIVLERIAKRFKIHQFASRSSIEFVDSKKFQSISSLQGKPKMLFEPTLRDWTDLDLKYWSKYCIDNRHLEYFGVYPVYSLHINKQLSYLYSYQDLAYCFQTITNGENDNWEIYFPMRDKKTKNRFLRNHSHMGGMDKVSTSNFGVITKSRKDIIVLKLFGIPAVHLAGEATSPNAREIQILKSSWRTIYSLLDFDKTGIHTAWKLRKEQNIIPLFLTNGKFNSLDFGAKDISDYIAKYGKNQTKELIEFIKDEGTEFNIEFLEFFNTLIHE